MSISTERVRQYATDEFMFAADDVRAMAAELLAVREAQSVPVKFAGWGLYHAERDEFGSWLKATPETDKSHAITKHGYVNVKLYTAPPVPAVPSELLDAMAEVIRISDRDHEAWDRAKAAISACRAAMLNHSGESNEKVPADYQHLKHVSESYFAVEKRLFDLAQRLKGPSFDHYAYSLHQAIDVLDKEIFGENEDSSAMLAAAPTPTKAVPDA